MENVKQTVEISKEEFELLMLGFMGVSTASTTREETIINLHKAVEKKMEICTAYRERELHTLHEKMVTMKLVSMFLHTVGEDLLKAQYPTKPMAKASMD